MLFVRKVIFWDFDGTLAYRPKMFSSSLRMVLDEHEKDHKITDECFGQWLQSGFPWHEPDKDHLHLRDPEAWWDNMCTVFERAYIMSGVLPEKACVYAKEARKHLVAPEHYSLYEDTMETLKYIRESGYKNIILSNHIPELPEILESIGLMEYIDICISSANVGFEKPNSRIFRQAIELADNPQEAWMVGDNLMADVRGAEAVGMRAILVRKPAHEPVKYFSQDLKGIIKLLN
jgi:putative hydrolase of the HAD superfamily